MQVSASVPSVWMKLKELETNPSFLIKCTVSYFIFHTEKYSTILNYGEIVAAQAWQNFRTYVDRL